MGRGMKYWWQFEKRAHQLKDILSASCSSCKFSSVLDYM